ncbi:aspartyl protease family protein 1-like [Curcuma longa]|uniref:aspartyl protease family protein 1-like n=1 Tax=Curcuma longa TaxID=136217 RepID=UPI003D9E520B
MSPTAASNFLLLLLAAASAVLAALTAGRPAAADTISFELHHKFSARVQEWATSRGDLPAKGTAEFYAALAHHDRRHHGRLLSSSDNSSAELLAFSPYGNVTTQIDSLGFLYYAILEVGTPKQVFLVALDTGSYLFWLPCDCLQCAPSYNSYLNVTFNNYSPGNSSTSQSVPCSSSLCQASCPANSSCPYEMLYGDGSTTSGVLVADTLYLMTEDTAPRSVEPTVVFGCGMNQTGGFLTAGSNGLFGLSMNSLAVPDMMAGNGLIANSFSMCFSEDHVGRLNFGDKGSPQQQETPLVGRHYYAINITTTMVGNTTIARPFTAIVDSGTSFTYLAEPIYTSFTKNFDSQVRERRIPPSQDGFEYCYYLNPNQSTIWLPPTLFVTAGGGNFPVHDPIIVFIDERSSAPVAYCLAVFRASHVYSIIGENFFTGLRIVFDRERMILGWENFDCYKRIGSSTISPSSSPPLPSVRPSSPPSSSPVLPSSLDNSPSSPLNPRLIQGGGGSCLSPSGAYFSWCLFSLWQWHSSKYVQYFDCHIMLNASMNKILKWDLASVERLWVEGDASEEPGALPPSHVSPASQPTSVDALRPKTQGVGSSRARPKPKKPSGAEGPARPQPTEEGQKEKKKVSSHSATVEAEQSKKRKHNAAVAEASSEQTSSAQPLVRKGKGRLGEELEAPRSSSAAQPSDMALEGQGALAQSPPSPSTGTPPDHVRVDPGGLFAQELTKEAIDRLEAHQALVPKLGMVELSDHLYESYIKIGMEQNALHRHLV